MKSRLAPLGLCIGAIALLAACSSAHKRQVLTFFFDGVPPEKSAGSAPAPLVANAKPDAAPAVPALYLLARAAPPGMRHKPYADRECLSCHESQFSQKLRGEVAEICQLCHKNVYEPRPFRHAPVEAGYCLGCHQAHESLEPALLVKPARKVCAECHEEEAVLGTPAHAKIGQAACHSCHDPHGGRDPYFLKPRTSDTTVAQSALPGSSP